MTWFCPIVHELYLEPCRRTYRVGHWTVEMAIHSSSRMLLTLPKWTRFHLSIFPASFPWRPAIHSSFFLPRLSSPLPPIFISHPHYHSFPQPPILISHTYPPPPIPPILIAHTHPQLPIPPTLFCQYETSITQVQPTPLRTMVQNRKKHRIVIDCPTSKRVNKVSERASGTCEQSEQCGESKQVSGVSK